MTETRAYTLGQTRAGRWWVQCTRRGCDHYRSGLGHEDARSIAERHQAEHDRRSGVSHPTVPRHWGTSYVVDSNSCHVWQRAKQTRGYGVVWFDGKVRLAHRVSWFLAHGAWPAPDKVLDHACDNKSCVNVDHLREMDNYANLRRAIPRGDAETEKRRERWRRANAKRRNYSPAYVLGGE